MPSTPAFSAWSPCGSEGVDGAVGSDAAVDALAEGFAARVAAEAKLAEARHAAVGGCRAALLRSVLSGRDGLEVWLALVWWRVAASPAAAMPSSTAAAGWPAGSPRRMTKKGALLVRAHAHVLGWLLRAGAGAQARLGVERAFSRWALWVDTAADADGGGGGASWALARDRRWLAPDHSGDLAAAPSAAIPADGDAVGWVASRRTAAAAAAAAAADAIRTVPRWRRVTWVRAARRRARAR